MPVWGCCCDAAAVRMLPCTLLLWGCYRAHCWCEDVAVRMLSCTLLLWRCYRTRCWCEDVTVHGAGVRMLPVWRCYRARSWCEDAAVKMLPWTLLVWGCCRCEDVAVRAAGVRMLLWRCYRGRCWCEDVTVHAAGVRMCEDVAARYRAADGADGAGVRMLLRDTVLRAVRTVLVWGCCCAIPCCGRCGRCWCENGAVRYRAADGADGARCWCEDVWGCCCAIPCCGRCGRCWCEDVAARYRAADGADGAGVRMLLRDTVLERVRTVLVWGWCCAIPCCGRCGRCCEDVAARYRAADGADGAGVRMLLRDTVLRTVRTVLVWGCCCAIPCCGRCGRCWCEDVAARYRAADGADGAGAQ